VAVALTLGTAGLHHVDCLAQDQLPLQQENATLNEQLARCDTGATAMREELEAAHASDVTRLQRAYSPAARGR
jgi:hypothetical protein